MQNHDSRECWYRRRAESFLARRHRTRAHAEQAYRDDLVLEDACGCDLPRAWLYRQKYKLNRVLEQFIATFDSPAKLLMPAPKPKVGSRFNLPELVTVLEPEEDYFSGQLKKRIVGYFSNPAVIVSHTESRDCGYWQNAKQFL